MVQLIDTIVNGTLTIQKDNTSINVLDEINDLRNNILDTSNLIDLEWKQAGYFVKTATTHNFTSEELENCRECLITCGCYSTGESRRVLASTLVDGDILRSSTSVVVGRVHQAKFGESYNAGISRSGVNTFQVYLGTNSTCTI